MPINPAFVSVRSIHDLVDALAANPAARAFTRNDLVRAWNILVTARTSPSSSVTLAYSEINISQSSVRTIVSNLNQLYRHLGLLTASQKITISYADFYTATISIADLHENGAINSLAWDLGERAFTQGRRQDRTSARHQDRHRRRHGVVSAVLPTANVVNAEAIAEIVSTALAFDPFEGIDSALFDVLRSEANA